MIIYNKKVLSWFNPNNYILRQKCNFHNHQVENNRAFFSKHPRCISSYGSGHIISGPCQILVFKIQKNPSFLKFYFFTDFLYPFWLFENPSWNIIVLLDLKDLFITLQTKFLYWAKLVDSVTRLQLPAVLVIPVNQVSRNLSKGTSPSKQFCLLHCRQLLLSSKYKMT